MSKQKQQLSKQSLLKLARVHRQASVIFWVAFAYPLLLMLLIFSENLLVHSDFVFLILLLLVPVLFSATWIQYMRLRRCMGYRLHDQIILTIMSLVIPLLALILMLDTENKAVRILNAHGLKHGPAGFAEKELVKLDAQVCLECMYDLRGLDHASVCPECGTLIQRPQSTDLSVAA